MNRRRWRHKNKRCIDCGIEIDDRASRCKPHSKKRKRNPSFGKISGSNNPRWKGGRMICEGGYIAILNPAHPHATKHGYVLEHRLVMEQYLGRHLNPGEVVHHINGNPVDNRKENLSLFASGGKHRTFHGKERSRDSVGRF